MLKQQTIKCAFCQGTGEHPHFTGSCPVCKGRGKNQIRGKVVSCRDCRGSGQKGGTTLTCFTCGGLGVVPDTAEIFRKAKKEIEKARREIRKEREEFREKKETEESVNEGEDSKGKIFCQSCAKKIEKNSALRVCLDCFRKMKGR